MCNLVINVITFYNLTSRAVMVVETRVCAIAFVMMEPHGHADASILTRMGATRVGYDAKRENKRQSVR